MSIQSPVGTLDIKNATLRVGKLEVSNIQGVDTALNVTRANSVLIYDDQASTTTFTGFTSSVGVRDTVGGYLDVADGYVYWGQKLPNAWVMDFEMDIRSGTNPGPLYANVFTTTNTGGDGYSFTFNDSNDKISLYYDSTLLTEATVTGLFTATENWQKVVINYERGMIAISLGGSRKFYYKDIERSTPYVNGEYTNFSSASTDGRKIRNLRIVNGEKWMYTGESNIAYTQGSVGIGVSDPQYTLDVGGDINLSGSFYQGGSPFVSSLWTDGTDSLYYRSNVEVGTGNLFVDTTTSRVGIGTRTPGYDLDVNGDINFTGTFYQGGSPFVSSLWTSGNDSLYYTASNVGIGTDTAEYTLDVHGNANVGALTATSVSGDGSALYGIQSSNVSDFASNVTRIGTLETDLGSNVTRIGTLETDLGSNVTRIGTLETDLGSNATRIGTLETDLGSNATRIGTLETDLGSNVTRIGTLETDLGSNVTRIGTLETDLGSNVTRIGTLETDLGSNATRIGTLETDLGSNVTRIGTLETDLSDNSSRITSIESGAHTFTGIKTFEDDVILESNLRVNGDLLVANTVHMIVSDPIMELGANNLNTGDLGIIMTRHGETGNVAIVYDESQDVLNVGYTLSNAYENAITMDTANSLTLQVNSALNVGSNIAMNDTASNVIEVSGNVKTDSLFLGNFEVVASQGLSHVTAVSAATNDTVYLNNPTTGLVVDSNVEIGENLTVEGDLEFNGNLTMNTITVQTLFTLDHVVSQGNTTSNTVQFTNPTTSLTATGNVEVGGELSVSGNVGIGTTSPMRKLHVYTSASEGNTQLLLQSANQYSSLHMKDSGGGIIAQNDQGAFRLITGYDASDSGGTEKFRVTGSGNVGIGTASPGYTLDVAGTSNAATYYQNDVELYAQRRWEVDLTGQSTGNFYPVELKAPYYEGSPDLPDMFPVHFKVFGESLGGGDSYNESTLVGYARGGGWSDHRHMYDVHYRRYIGGEKRFEGLYRGTQDYGGGIVIYMRGGYRYSVLTDATEVNTYTSAQTLDNSVFAIKDVDGSDVSGTSTAIGRIVHIAGTGDVEKRFMSGNLQFDGNVGIGTTSPATKLHVEHYGSAIGDFEGIRIANHATNLHATSRPAYEFVVSDINSGTGIGSGKFAIGYRGTTSASRTDRLVIDDSGNVGIGTTSPSYPLHVTGSAGNMPSMKYFNSASTALQSGANDAITIYAAGNIYASGLVAASDERIKKDIVDADDAECLEVLRLLKPKKYQYKDEVSRGTEPVWGFIAQEVRETLPYATQLRQDVLPNIYELANVSQSNVITFTNFNTSNLESNATTLIRTKGIDGEDHDIHLAEVIDEHTIRVEEDLTEWIGSVDETGNVITEITTTTITPEEYEGVEDTSGYVANISGYQNANVVISVEEYNALEDTTGYEEIIDNYTKTVTTYPGTQLFVYGQEVDDFIFVKKEAIWTIATAALQEVDRQLQAEKAKVATLETQLASVLARLDALENP